MVVNVSRRWRNRNHDDGCYAPSQVKSRWSFELRRWGHRERSRDNDDEVSASMTESRCGCGGNKEKRGRRSWGKRRGNAKEREGTRRRKLRLSPTDSFFSLFRVSSSLSSRSSLSLLFVSIATAPRLRWCVSIPRLSSDSNARNYERASPRERDVTPTTRARARDQILLTWRGARDQLFLPFLRD